MFVHQQFVLFGTIVDKDAVTTDTKHFFLCAQGGELGISDGVRFKGEFFKAVSSSLKFCCIHIYFKMCFFFFPEVKKV